MSDGSAEDRDKVWEKNKSSFKAKRNSEYYDPCQEAANRSMRCLKRNQHDKSLCQDMFDAYKECKKAWIEQMKTEKASRPWF